MTVSSFLMILNRKIPAVGKASYGRDLFLHLYCPHSRSKGHAARDEFMDWVKRCTPLYGKLQELGYKPSLHSFTPKMVDYIFYYLGEPDGVGI